MANSDCTLLMKSLNLAICNTVFLMFHAFAAGSLVFGLPRQYIKRKLIHGVLLQDGCTIEFMSQMQVFG